MELKLRRNIEDWKRDFLFEERARSSFSVRRFPPNLYDWQFAPTFTSTRLITEAVGDDIKGNLFNATLIKQIKDFFKIVGIDLKIKHEITEHSSLDIDITDDAYNVLISMPQEMFNLTVRDKLFELLENEETTDVSLENTEAELKIAPILLYKNGAWIGASIQSVKALLFESGFALRLGFSVMVLDEQGETTFLKDATKDIDYLWRYV